MKQITKADVLKIVISVLFIVSVIIIFKSDCLCSKPTLETNKELILFPIPTNESLQLVQTNTKIYIHQKWLDNWLLGKTCGISCWQDIIPGVTSIEEAIIQLENNPLITNIRGNKTDYITWDWKEDPEHKKSSGGHIDGKYINNKNTVISIELDIERNNLSLQEVIKTYGEPSNVWTKLHCVGGGLEYYQDVLYEQYGYNLFQWETVDHPPVFGSDMFLDGVKFAEKTELITELSKSGQLYAWNGINGAYNFRFDKWEEYFYVDCRSYINK
jgi:hypothetical protein